MLTVLLATGCYWARYDRLVRTHVEVMLAMAQKIEDVTRVTGAPPAEAAEYRYPLERARDFMRIVTPRFEGRASLAALDELCRTYESLLRVAAATRATETARDAAATTTETAREAPAVDDARRRLEESLAAVRRDATRVIRALDEERMR